MIDERNRYNRIYAARKEHTYGEGKPERCVSRILDYRDSGSVLDVGAGDGRNAIFLASRGFNVKAVDISEVGLEKLQGFAAQKGVSVETEVCDVVSWSFDQGYDVMVCTAVLQNIPEESAIRLLENMKRHTRPDGLHALVVFTTEGTEAFRNATGAHGLFVPPNWLRDFYHDWEVLEYTEQPRSVRLKSGDGSIAHPVVASILAKHSIKSAK